MGEYKIISGAGAEFAKYTNNTFQRVFIPQAEDTLTTVDYSSYLDFFKYSAFVQVSRSFLTDKLTLSPALRADGASYSNETSNPLRQISPRVSFSYALS